MESFLNSLDEFVHSFSFNLFGTECTPKISINWYLLSGNCMLNLDELVNGFTLDEVKNAVFSFNPKKEGILTALSIAFIKLLQRYLRLGSQNSSLI